MTKASSVTSRSVQGAPVPAAAILTEQPALWVGIDLGTQSVKAIVVTDQGDIRASAQSPIEGHRSGNIHEQDPTEWIAATQQVLSSAIGALDPRERMSIRGLAISSTSGTLATVDARGAPIGAGIMYDDGRGAPLRDAVIAADPEYWARTGTKPQPSWAIVKLAWLAAQGLPAGTERIAHQGDVVAAAMVGGPVATDWSSALKSGYDLQNRRWPSSVLNGIGLREALLPAVVAPGTQLETTSAQWESATGLSEGTPIFAGTTDGCAGQFGAGALGLGSWHSVVGTTLVLKGVTSEAMTDDGAGIYSHLAPGGDAWLPGGASSAGAGALSAFLPKETDLAELTRAARTEWARVPQPIAYPLVSPGERFPLTDAAFAGFLLPSDYAAAADDGDETVTLPLSALAQLPPKDVLSAIFIGVAAVERLCFERLGLLSPAGSPQVTVAPHRLSTSGGGASNEDWVRLRASMLGVPITRLTDAEGTLGMAALAAWGAQKGRPGAPSLAQIAENMSAVRDVIEPDPKLITPLASAYARFTRALAHEIDRRAK